MALFNNKEKGTAPKKAAAPKKEVEKTVADPELTKQEIDSAAEPGTATRPIEVKEEKTPELKEDGPRIFFSPGRLGYKIGMVPSSTSYEMHGNVKVKRIHKGSKICFINGRYVAKNDEEVKFLEAFMKEHPDRVFSVDPQEKELMAKLAKVVASHKASIAGAKKGKQGPIGA